MLEPFVLPVCTGALLLTAMVMATIHELKVAIAFVGLTIILLALSFLFT
jgi:hypothetical protein